VKDSRDRAEKIYERQKLLQAQGATPRLTFEKARQEFDNATLEYDSLASRGKLAEDRVVQLNHDIDAARKALDERNTAFEQAEENLAATQIHAPADGLVLSRIGEAGAEVQRGSKDLVRLAVELSQLKVIVTPDKTVLPRLRPGLAALVIVSELPSEALPGQIIKVEGDRVAVAFVSPVPAIKPGLTAQVRLKLP
jgi:multidrug resistance efflux pump